MTTLMKNTIVRGDFMGTETEHMSLSQILNNFNQIIIPDVQRDYVMGSGGEKLIKLLTAMAESNDKEEKFNFSCLVGYKDKDNNLYIYDGQQRLATLVCLCSYLNKDTEIQNLLEKFSFTKRDVANDWLSNPTKIKENVAVDFTTYSLAKLIKEFSTHQIRINYSTYKLSDKITLKFLFEKMFFDMVLVNKISDAEQFFLDINDGLDLKSYEIYKAELYHHAEEVLKESFKEFALKMENEWLKFFLPYQYHEKKWIDGAYKDVVICEEEMLVFFLQYCFRMMWIEEKGSDNEFKSVNISWLKKEHLKRAEQITDAIINVTNTVSVSDISCINYSYNKSKGQHWNINDKNYIAMLKVFLKNVYNTEEINKDIIIWCYISKLPFIDQNENSLYKYLRFVKKLLNNNRKVCNNAEIEFVDWGVHNKKIVYARYYVQGIPQYYIVCGKEECDGNTLFTLNTIIVLDKAFTLSGNGNFVDVYLSECKNDSLKSILKKEQQKQNSQEKECIEKYENLPFINGLVDNFLIYRDETCQLNDWVKKGSLIHSNIRHSNEEYQYKAILEYISSNKIDIKNLIFSNIYISWYNYCGTKHTDKGSLIPRTWCDFFTNENGISFYEEITNNSLDYLSCLPDGWIFDKKIFQPEDDIYSEHGKGFAARSKTHSVLSMNDFYGNFRWICIYEPGKYIIDGKEAESLPEYLKSYNGDNWIVNKLSTTRKVFFSEKEYLNQILFYKFRIFMEERGENVEIYLKGKNNHMRYQEMNGNSFFIKLQET